MPRDPFARLDDARARLDAGRPDLAFAALRGAFPDAVAGEASFLRAEALRASGYFRRAIAAYREALSKFETGFDRYRARSQDPHQPDAPEAGDCSLGPR